jgi:KipI family sensor histidine kinase inhibitor
MSTVRIEPLGDKALLVRFGDRIDPEINALALIAAEAVRAANLNGIDDIVPAYASLCVSYDPLRWIDPVTTETAYSHIAKCINEIVNNVAFARATHALSLIDVPVCYSEEFGPDLDHVARHAGIEHNEVVARHIAIEYRVAMLGFAPGFPYLLGLDPALHTPRRTSPRTRVPAGSVAIGGAQTGIYPHELPGGWHLIGRTPLTLFDASLDSPAMFAPGQTVRFHSIDAHEFERLLR